MLHFVVLKCRSLKYTWEMCRRAEKQIYKTIQFRQCLDWHIPMLSLNCLSLLRNTVGYFANSNISKNKITHCAPILAFVADPKTRLYYFWRPIYSKSGRAKLLFLPSKRPFLLDLLKIGGWLIVFCAFQGLGSTHETDWMPLVIQQQNVRLLLLFSRPSVCVAKFRSFFDRADFAYNNDDAWS